MEKKSQEMRSSLMVNVVNGFQNLEINFLLILMLTKVIIWAEINIDQLEINGRLNNANR